MFFCRFRPIDVSHLLLCYLSTKTISVQTNLFENVVATYLKMCRYIQCFLDSHRHLISEQLLLFSPTTKLYGIWKIVELLYTNSIHFHIQWGKKVFSQPPIVQFLPLKKMREACNFHHRYTSTIQKSRKSHCRIFKEFICKLWWKISIWSPTNKQDCWLSQTCNFFFKRLLCPPLVTCINGICLNSLSV